MRWYLWVVWHDRKTILVTERGSVAPLLFVGIGLDLGLFGFRLNISRSYHDGFFFCDDFA